MSMSVGFVGLGLMGFPMAKRLLGAGNALHIYNRTREKAAPLLEQGATWCNTPAEVASRSEVVFTMVTNDDALRDVVYGTAGIDAGLKRGAIHIDSSTVSPELTGALEKFHASAGRSFLHAPVLGNVHQAAEGTVLVFVGGDTLAVKRVESLLQTIGRRHWTFPTAPQASNTKIVCNSFIAGTFVMLAQGLLFATKANVGGEALLEILKESATNSNMIQVRGARLLDRDFTPHFFVENLLKDSRLMIDSARTLGTPAPVAELAASLLDEAVRQGFGKEDYPAAIKVWESLAGVTVRADRSEKKDTA